MAVEYENLLADARAVATKLLCKAWICDVNKLSEVRPTLGCPTRWGSDYDMSTRLLQMREVVEKVYLMHKSNVDLDWDKLSEYVSVFKEVRRATALMEQEFMTPGEFLAILRVVLRQLSGNSNAEAD